MGVETESIYYRDIRDKALHFLSNGEWYSRAELEGQILDYSGKKVCYITIVRSLKNNIRENQIKKIFCEGKAYYRLIDENLKNKYSKMTFEKEEVQ